MPVEDWETWGLKAGISTVTLGIIIESLASSLFPLWALIDAIAVHEANHLYISLYGIGFSLPFHAIASTLLLALGFITFLHVTGRFKANYARLVAITGILYILYVSLALITAGILIGGVLLLTVIPTCYFALQKTVTAIRILEKVPRDAAIREKLYAKKIYREYLREAAILAAISLIILAAGDYYYTIYQGILLFALLQSAPQLVPGIFVSWFPLELITLIALIVTLIFFYSRGTLPQRDHLRALTALYMFGILASSTHIAHNLLTANTGALPLRLLYLAGYTLLAMGSAASIIFITLGVVYYMLYNIDETINDASGAANPLYWSESSKVITDGTALH